MSIKTEIKTEEAKIVDTVEVEITGAINQFTKSYKNGEDWSANYLKDTMVARQRMQKIPEQIKQALATYKASIISECERENVVSVEIVKGYNEEKKILAEALKNVGDDDFHLQFELQTRLKTIDTALQALNSLKV